MAHYSRVHGITTMNSEEVMSKYSLNLICKNANKTYIRSGSYLCIKEKCVIKMHSLVGETYLMQKLASVLLCCLTDITYVA